MFSTLRAHNLVLKRSKCVFGERRMQYLGHVISNGAMAMDDAKISVVQAWPLLCFVKVLCAFLSLARYYCRIIANYGVITGPLMALLKKEAFRWTPEATAAFDTLKRALTTGPVLQLPNIEEPFIFDCDASGTGFGVVLH